MLEQGIPAAVESTVEVDGKSSGGRRRKRSAAAKLLQAAALAAALVPLASVTADASSLSCHFSGSSFDCNEGFFGGALYQFGSYSLELKFEQATSFNVEFTDFLFTHDEMQSRFTGEFEGWEPLPICPGCLNDQNELAEYVEFRVTSDPLPQQGTDFVGDYELYIYWLADTNAAFGNPQMLHDLSNTSDAFDTNITIAGSYFSEAPGCVFNEVGCTDPGNGGRDNMFTGFTEAQNPVPEPASLFLLGTGVSALMYRRRRNAQSKK